MDKGKDEIRVQIQRESNADEGAGRIEGHYATLSVALQSLQEVAMKIFNQFVQAVEDVPSVEQVSAEVNGTYLHIVTYTSESNKEERYQIYEVEKHFYQRYPELQLEFDLLDRQGYPMESEEVSGKYISVLRKRPDVDDVKVQQ